MTCRTKQSERYSAMNCKTLDRKIDWALWLEDVGALALRLRLKGFLSSVWQEGERSRLLFLVSAPSLYGDEQIIIVTKSARGAANKSFL